MRFLRLFALFSFLLPWVVFAQGRPTFEPGIEFLMEAEQKRISRELDTSRIMSPMINQQDSAYTPETGAVFEIKTYWVDASTVHAFFADVPGERDLWEQNLNGRKQYRLLVHPESESFYEEFLRDSGAQRAENFLATATSSSRTLLMWHPNRPDAAFFGKVSLNKDIGGTVRTIPLSETARSVGVTNVLAAEQSALPESFGFFPETFSLIPKDMDRGGMIIRQIPKEVAEGKVLAIPLFALYGNSDPNVPPLLAKMISDSGLNAEDFIRLKIIRPFVSQWLRMEADLGITMEPHAQNVLIGLDPRFQPNGMFYHRDFGGFSLDLPYRKELGRPQPTLPNVRGVDRDYHQVSHDKAYHMALPRSLATFFAAGFLYNLDQKIPQWRKNGWISGAQSLWSRFWPGKNRFQRMLVEETNLAMKEMSDNKVRLARMTPLSASLGRATDALRVNRHPPGSRPVSCSLIFAY